MSEPLKPTYQFPPSREEFDVIVQSEAWLSERWHDAESENARLRAALESALVDMRLTQDRCGRLKGIEWDHLDETITAAERALRGGQDRPDPRDPDPRREGIFRDHNCWKCGHGTKPCVEGGPNRCSYPRARND